MSVHILTTEQENVLCGIGLELGQADEWVHIDLAEHGTCSACLAELGDVTTPTGSTPGRVYTPIQGESGRATHAVAGDFDGSRPWVQTVCGRDVKWRTMFSPATWPTFQTMWFRLGKTHQTGICGQCVRKTPDAREV